MEPAGVERGTPWPSLGPVVGAAERWRSELEGWTIPDAILRQAPEPPWGFPVEMFRARMTAVREGDASRRRALEALPPGGCVLDVGCGGGAAGLALVPPAGTVVGVDQSAAMLEEMAAAASRMGVAHRTIQGVWPDDAAGVPVADVVVCHNVAYNVSDLGSFARALSAHARRRVVMELTQRHPLVATAGLWLRFHGLHRPSGPDATLARAVLAEAGIDAADEASMRPPRSLPHDAEVAFTRRRLCLPPERDAEVDRALAENPDRGPRQVVTLWWDVPAGA